jgi:hypothetical protein
MSQKRILFVFTSADKLLDGRATGWYLPEGMHAYAHSRVGVSTI